jgi:hypothetical protein
MSKSKQIGTTAETWLVKYLKSEGFSDADREPLRGKLDTGDVRTAGVCWEVKAGATAKGASDGLVASWLAETEAERVNAGADLGVLVMARASYGEKRVGQWWAVVPLWAFLELHEVGLGPGPTEPVRVHLATLVGLLKDAGYGDRWLNRRQPQVQATPAAEPLELRAGPSPKLTRGARYLSV